MRLESPACPLPCWNLPHYNLTRWAVSGRDDVKVNTQCHRLFKSIKDAQTLSQMNGREDVDLAAAWSDLVLLWDSDVRTWVTEDKYEDFGLNAGKLNFSIKHKLDDLLQRITVEENIALINTNDDLWEAEPFVIDCIFSPGQYPDGIAVEIDGVRGTCQMENVTRYQDRSIRSVDLVILPTVAGHQVAQVKLLSVNKSEPIEYDQHPRGAVNIATDHVVMKLMAGNNDLFLEDAQLAPQGCNVLAATFPTVDSKVLLGTFRMGDDLVCSGDFQMRDLPSGRFLYDHGTAQVFLPKNLNSCPVRIPLLTKIKCDPVVIEKTFFIYRHLPRIDVNWVLTMVGDVIPEFCRINSMSINADAFDRDTLKYSIVNGSDHVEQHYLKGVSIKQDAYCFHPSAATTTRQCMGGSEGWIDISDSHKGVTLVSDKTNLYSVPLLRYEEHGNSYLLTVKNSIGETDNTGSIFYRGYNTAYFSYIAHINDLSRTRSMARHINNKLLVKRRGLE